jgi:hypothetical protein
MASAQPAPRIGQFETAESAARSYIALGLSLVPVPIGQKGPRIKGWETRDFRDFDFSKPTNLGLKTGKPSGGLVDVDLDCHEAVIAARRWLPTTDMRFGRDSRPSSHYLFESTSELRREVFKDPESSGQSAVLLELRGDRHQTMVPPSTHPQGEKVRWELEAGDAQGS